MSVYPSVCPIDLLLNYNISQATYITILGEGSQAFYPIWRVGPQNFCVSAHLGCTSQPAKLDLNKKSLSKQEIIQNFSIDAQGFRKTKNENPPTWEIRFTS